MKTFSVIALLAFCVFCGVVFSSLVTITAWNIQIEPRAFRCNDSLGWPFENYWTNIATHQAARDTLSAGWTWDKIETDQKIYISVFYLLWLASALIFFRLISKRIRRPGSTPNPSSIAPSGAT